MTNFQLPALLSLLVFMLLLTLTVTRVSQDITEQPIQASVPTGTLYFLPKEANLPPDSTYFVYLNSEGSEVAYTSFEIVFNPQHLRISNEVTVSNSAYRIAKLTPFTEANQTGKLHVVLALEPGVSSPKGDFELVRINFVANTNSTILTKLSFDTSKVQVVHPNQSIFNITAQSADINLNPIINLPTPTPISIPTPTNTPDSGGVMELLPIADATVKEININKNYGSEIYIESDGDPKKNMFMMFDLTALAGRQVKSAQLVFTPVLNRRVDAELHRVTNTTWNENTITWSNQPSMNNLIGRIQGRVEINQAVTIDVTSSVGESVGGRITFGVKDSSSGYTFRVNSREASSDRPQLKVEYQ